MAGFRQFQTGEVLTSANVNNFLMKQSVMVFDDATARTTALGAEVAEGMLTFNKDTAQLEVYDGTNFVVAAPPQNLVAVKSAIFTGVQADNVAGSGNVAVTDLTITHALTDASNRLIISAFLGAAAISTGYGNVGIAVHDGTGLIAMPTSPGSRAAVTAGGAVVQFTEAGNQVVTMPSVTFVHTPGDTDSRTYTVRAINITVSTRTLFINRSQADDNILDRARAVSSLVITEVSA